jgi:hypothetical protein
VHTCFRKYTRKMLLVFRDAWAHFSLKEKKIKLLIHEFRRRGPRLTKKIPRIYITRPTVGDQTLYPMPQQRH